MIPRRFAAVAGFIAGGVAVTAGMLLAAIGGVASPIDSVGSEVIDRVPLWLKELAIRWFGTNDKLALRLGIVVVLAAAAPLVGLAAARRRGAAIAGFAAFGLIGAAAAVHRPGASWAAALPSLLGAVVGASVLVRLLTDGSARQAETPGPSRAPLGWDRRRFLATSGAAAAGAMVAGGLARRVNGRQVASIRQDIPASLPPVEGAPVAIPAGADVNPVTPFVTPNRDFYRIDTALSFPRVRLDSWQVDITGLVDRPLTLTYDDLRSRPQVERVITLACVSNEVGGRYISNAVFQGVLLADLLNEAGVQAGAEQVFSTSIDGWTCGFPVAAALDGRDAMIALGMNGEALPLEHGFPARLVVPGLYGYVSATKWLKTIELTTWDRATGYWVPRGWAREAPIKTQSRIDVPRSGQPVEPGPVRIAGVAWAQHRGVSKVEVRIDDGPWQEADLGDDVSDDAWRQWVTDWQATTGSHTIQVRATDRTGATQTADRAAPAPDGATGYHTINVTVR
ncbi:MAG: molybdopterin-dependent oxidoreductase [Acidimicrobiales bacterium]